MNFIGVSTVDGRIVEFNRSSASLPASSASTNYIEVTDAENASIRIKRQELTDARRTPVLFFNEALKVHYPEDTRPIFNVDITTGNPEIGYSGIEGTVDYIAANDTDVATVTITMVNSEGDTVPYTGIRTANFFGNRVALLTYVNGVAIKTFKTNVSGLYTLASTNEHILIGEVSLLALEL